MEEFISIQRVEENVFKFESTDRHRASEAKHFNVKL